MTTMWPTTFINWQFFSSLTQLVLPVSLLLLKRHISVPFHFNWWRTILWRYYSIIYWFPCLPFDTANTLLVSFAPSVRSLFISSSSASASSSPEMGNGSLRKRRSHKISLMSFIHQIVTITQFIIIIVFKRSIEWRLPMDGHASTDNRPITDRQAQYDAEQYQTWKGANKLINWWT